MSGIGTGFAPGHFGRLFDLGGKTALIAGGGGGLGSAIAMAFADHGARVIVADIDGARAAGVAAECARPGIGEPVGVHMDVTDHAGTRAIVDRLDRETGGISLLVSCAGINIRRPVIEYTAEEWDRIIAINLTGTFNVIQAAARGMLARRYGRVLSIGSVSSLLGHPEHAPYAATKGGIAIMTKAMATEWATQGVTANVIGPAYTETNLTAGLLAQPGKREELTRSIPMGRLGRPEDVAGAAVYLCSDAAGFVTGQTLYVDGGRTAD